MKRVRRAVASSMPFIQQKIGVSALKVVSIRYEGDLYELGLWLLRLDLARSTPTCIPRHTVHGLANCYSYLAHIDLQEVSEILTRHGLPLGATIERDENMGASDYPIEHSVSPSQRE